MSLLFSSVKINNLTIPNRFYRSATFESLSNSRGDFTPELVTLYKKYKKVGLIMSSCTQVDDRAKHHPTMLSLSKSSIGSDHLKSFMRLSDEIHKRGQCVGVQLSHSGLNSKKSLIFGREPEGPNSMSLFEIERVIENFSKSAHVAYKCGFDAVQIHCAGTYLLGTFLSSVSNRREDEFGGSVYRRCEIVRRVIQKVRSKVPSGFPLLIKINGHSDKAFVPPDEQRIIAKIMEDAGADAIEVAVSATNKGSNKNAFVSFGERAARVARSAKYDYECLAQVKKEVKVPVISTGGHLVMQDMESFVDGGLCDMIGLSRPLIREPGLVEMFERGETNKSSCKNCNGCLTHTSVREKPLVCVNP